MFGKEKHAGVFIELFQSFLKAVLHEVSWPTQ